jgi:hypothetical protein
VQLTPLCTFQNALCAPKKTFTGLSEFSSLHSGKIVVAFRQGNYPSHLSCLSLGNNFRSGLVTHVWKEVPVDAKSFPFGTWLGFCSVFFLSFAFAQKKPNILAIWGARAS